MKDSDKRLLQKVENLKEMLVSIATSSSYKNSTNQEYKLLRRELRSIPLLKAKLPPFIHSCRDFDEFWGFIKQKFAHYQERRDYLQNEFDPVLSMLESGLNVPSDAAIIGTLSIVNSTHVQETWQKALERRNSDPEGAITASRTLLESVCKYILDENNVTYDDKYDLPKLYNMVAEQLHLSPSQHTEKVFKQILGSCQAVVEGLGTLRNKLSDAHGKGKTGVKPATRHAELAVNLAGTMATFLIATWDARKKP